MSISCEKTFSLHIDEGCASTDDIFYWPMEEVSGDRIDGINGVHLVEGVVSAQVVQGAGKVDFGQEWKVLINSYPYYSTSASASLAPSVNGFSLCFWIKVDTRWPGTDVRWEILFYGNTGTPVQMLLSLGKSALGVVSDVLTVQDGVVGHTEYLNGSVTDGVWQFVHMFCRMPEGEMGMSINLGAETLATFIAAPVVSATGVVRLREIGTVGMGLTVDEILYKTNGCLSATQLAYLYNSGNGRTLPICIPSS